MLGEGISYKGVLTFSIIIPEDRDPVLVDYHVRFNDPAAQAFIPLVKNDFLEIVEAMNRNNLKNVKLSSYGGFSVAVVLASEGYPVSPVIGRDDEIRRVLQILSRRTKNNPILVGEPGVGKTAISEGIANLTE